MSSAILERLEPRFDAIVEAIYRAGTGVQPWIDPLSEIAAIFEAWTVQLLGVNKRSGALSFSFEAGHGPAAAAIDYLREYHKCDPRLARSMPLAAGEFFSCEEHFDDAFVAKDRFYQEYLIPYGARYLYGSKLLDDEAHTVLIGNVTQAGRGPLSGEEKHAFRRLAAHFRKAIDIRREIARREERRAVGLQLLEQLRQPVVLLDNQRRISYRNASAVDMLARGDPVVEAAGQLMCRDAQADLELTIALRDLALVPISSIGVQPPARERRHLRLPRADGRRAAATLTALRPEQTMQSFSSEPLAMFTLFEPRAAVDVDPFSLASTFDLTPAESRIAALLVNGRSPKQCATQLGLETSTVRSHLVSIYAKTGAAGQADLVRMILATQPI